MENTYVEETKFLPDKVVENLSRFCELSANKTTKNWKMLYWQHQKSLGGGGSPFYKLYRYIMYRYVLPHWDGVLCHFGLKKGIHFVYR